MYYSSGNYEAFARPLPPKGVDRKAAYLVGSGLAALTAACYLVRDGQMKGERIHIFEKESVPGGACDGCRCPGVGYVMRGDRKLDDHFEVMWDLLRSIPSLEREDASVLDEIYWLNKKDPNRSLCRVTEQRGQNALTDGKFGLSDRACTELMKLFITSDEELYNKQITDVFDDEIFSSDFWLYWRTMFAFQPWHSALEMKRSLKRFIHHVGGLSDLKSLRFTRYNQYDSLILPMVRYLEGFGVRFHYNTRVTNVEFECVDGKKQAKTICLDVRGEEDHIDLTENDLVFITNGSCVENASTGSQDEPPVFDAVLRPGGGWALWKRIAAQDEAFGRPEVFRSRPELTNWVCATVTTLDERIVPYLKTICQRDPFSGRTVTGGIVTVRDSGWLLSWTFNRQPQFHDQPKGQLVGWMYGLAPDNPGDYVKKPMRECTGKEICTEWLYHLGVPEAEIEDLAEHSANTVPVLMPYGTASFLPHTAGDRPDVVPQGAVNFAFIGQFAETPRDAVSTTEYSMRTGMEAVYTLLDIDRGVPEVWGSTFDVRDLMDAIVELRDGKPLTDVKLNWLEKLAMDRAIDKVQTNDLGKLLQEHKII